MEGWNTAISVIFGMGYMNSCAEEGYSRVRGFNMPNWIIQTGNAFTLIDSLPPESIDVIVTSPPYWKMKNYGGETHDPSELGWELTYDAHVEKLTAFFMKCHRVLHPRGVMWVNIGTIRRGCLDALFDLTVNLRKALWVIAQEVIWDKCVAPSYCKLKNGFLYQHELIMVYAKQEDYYFNNSDPQAVKDNGYPRWSIWKIPLPEIYAKWRYMDHKTPFPLSLVTVMIASSINEDRSVYNGEPMVLDPFSGSGTSGVAALQLECNYIGLELYPDMAEKSRARLRETLPLLSYERKEEL